MLLHFKKFYFAPLAAFLYSALTVVYYSLSGEGMLPLLNWNCLALAYGVCGTWSRLNKELNKLSTKLCMTFCDETKQLLA